MTKYAPDNGWRTKVMHTDEAKGYLKQYNFHAESLSIIHIYNYDVLVVFKLKELSDES